jgi:hypothetical protein
LNSAHPINSTNPAAAAYTLGSGIAATVNVVPEVPPPKLICAMRFASLNEILLLKLFKDVAL